MRVAEADHKNHFPHSLTYKLVENNKKGRGVRPIGLTIDTPLTIKTYNHSFTKNFLDTHFGYMG